MKLFRRPRAKAAPLPIARRVRELEVVTARLVREGFAGQYHAAFHGKGLEFSQVREYFPGDDVRTIDWNVTARTGAPHVKQYVEERDLTIIFALDVSASMQFGSLDRRKSTVASEVVAALAYAALKNRDRVGLVEFDEQRVRSFLPPRRGRAQVQAAISRSIAFAMSPVTPATSVLPRGFAALERYVGNAIRKRAVIIVLSDFLDGDAPRVMKRLNVRHDVVAIHLHDPREAIFPKRGLVRLLDSESGIVRSVDLATPGVIDRGRANLLRIRHELRRGGVDSVELSTAAPYDRELVSFFKARVARRR